jgi:hypothetical protein
VHFFCNLDHAFCDVAFLLWRCRFELVFIDKDGKWYPLDEVNREELAEGLGKISKEAAKRLKLLKEQR